MVTVDTIARVRRAYFVQGRKIKAIARDLRLARNTVRDIVRAGSDGPEQTERRYVRKEQPLPQLGDFVSALQAMVTANAARSKRERLTYQRMFEELRLQGYAGGYDNVRRYAKAWAIREGERTAEAYVPLSFGPGEAYQFDWSHEIAVIGGVTVTVKVAQVRLCHSRMLFVRAYLREAQEMVFDAHEKAFQFFKGVPRRGISDYVSGHIIGVMCRSALCGREPCRALATGAFDICRPHNAQSEVSQFSKAASSRHTDLRGNVAEAATGGSQACSAASFERMLISA